MSTRLVTRQFNRTTKSIMKNIEIALFPLLFILCVCGFGIFEYPQGKPRLYFTILYLLISWPLYIYVIMETKMCLETFPTEYPLISYATPVVTLMISLISIYYYKRFKGCLKKLDIVNDTLEGLGTSKNYAHFRSRINWMIVGWLILTFLMNSHDSLILYHRPRSYITGYMLLPYIFNYSLNINTLYELTFLMLLRYVGSRYEQINQHIKKLIEQRKQQLRLIRRASPSFIMRRHLTDTSTSNQHLYILMHVYFELSSISRELNAIFGLQMMIQTVMFHLIILEFIIAFYDDVILLKLHFTRMFLVHVICTFFWTTRFILEIIFFNHICDGVCAKVNQTETFLNRLAIVTFDVETQENIEQFLLEILRKPMRISALGFYDYGYKLVRKFIGLSAQILVIVIQARQ